MIIKLNNRQRVFRIIIILPWWMTGRRHFGSTRSTRGEYFSKSYGCFCSCLLLLWEYKKSQLLFFYPTAKEKNCLIIDSPSRFHAGGVCPFWGGPGRRSIGNNRVLWATLFSKVSLPYFMALLRDRVIDKDLIIIFPQITGKPVPQRKCQYQGC